MKVVSIGIFYELIQDIKKMDDQASIMRCDDMEKQRILKKKMMIETFSKAKLGMRLSGNIDSEIKFYTNYLKKSETSLAEFNLLIIIKTTYRLSEIFNNSTYEYF